MTVTSISPPPSTIAPALLTPSEAARYLATTERHLRYLRDRHGLPAVHIGGKVRYRRADLDWFIAEGLDQ